MPKVSIIVPVYGVEKYIERCSESIFQQSFQDFELIFVNDCSKDRSEQILLKVIEKYKTLNVEVKLIKHEVNQGISAVRETGLNAASGDFVLYVDSDDYISPDMLKELVNKQSETTSDIVFCDYSELRNSRITYKSQALEFNDPLNMAAAMLREEIIWCPWNKLIRRSLFLQHSIHWPNGINIGEDFVVISKLFCYSKKTVHLNKSLYFYNRDNLNSYINAWSIEACNQNTNAVELVNSFLKNEFKNADMLEALIQTKLKARYAMIYTYNKELTKLAVDTFPETNTQIFGYKHAPIYWKLALFFLIKEQKLLLNISLIAIRVLQKIRAISPF